MNTLAGAKVNAVPSTGMSDAISVSRFIDALFSSRRLILVVTSAGLIASALAMLIKAPSYSSKFLFVPQSSQDQGRTGLANIAGQFGISLGAVGGGPQQPSQLYAMLLETRDVLSPIASDSFVTAAGVPKRMPLSKFLRVRGENAAVVTEQTMTALRRDVISTSVETRTTAVVTVIVRTGSPELSLELARRLLDGLNRFNRVARQSQAAAERRFVEGRLASAQAIQRAAEDSLQSFIDANRQVANSPGLVFRRDRLQREVNLRTQVVLALAQMNEDARLAEVRDTPVITVLEQPALPVLRDPTGWVLVVFAWTLAAFVLGVTVVMARAGRSWQRERESSESPSRAAVAESAAPA